MKFEVNEKLGGLLNLNFIATHKEKKILLKFQNSNLFCNRDLEIKIKTMINNDSNLLNAPKCYWSCRNLLIEEYLENTQIISYDQVQSSSELLG